MSDADQLKKLQSIDSEINSTQNRLKEIHDTLNNDAAVETARTAVTNTENTLQPLKTTAKDLELEIDGTVSKYQETEERLYSGAVKNTKELEDMQQEVQSLKGRQEQLEEK
ncbi:MAG: hypothetical protein AAF125_13375, partial [Chloroflexota bacterium]